MTQCNDSDTATGYICEDCGASAVGDFEDVEHIFGPHHANRPYRYRTRQYVAVDIAQRAVFEAIDSYDGNWDERELAERARAALAALPGTERP